MSKRLNSSLSSLLAVLFASLFSNVVLGQVPSTTEAIPRDSFLETVLIRESGFHFGSHSFRVVGRNTSHLSILGDGVAKLDLSSLSTEGEIVFLDGSSDNGRRELDVNGVSIVSGSSGPDLIHGNPRDNRIRGFGGDDTIFSNGGSSIISGGAGDDVLHGSSGSDVVRGGVGDDLILGGSGSDHLSGGLGSDYIYGGSGDDILKPGPPGVYAPFRRPRRPFSIKASAKNDIVFVIFDDLARSFYAEPNVVMPNLTSFAQTAVRFTNAYANSSLCNPSRCSLLTGMHPESTAVYGPLQNHSFPTSRYIQKHLQANGFEVGEFGKVRNHTVSTDRIGLDDHFFRHTQVKEASTVFGVIGLANRAEVSDVFSDAAAVDAATTFLNSKRTGPRATFFGLTRPHGPWIVPAQDWHAISDISDDEIKQYAASMGTVLGVHDENWLASISSYAKTSLGVSWNVGTEQQAINLIRHYLASAHFADRMFAEFMESVPDDLTVIVTSDHGMHLADRRTGLSKATLWPQSLRVPLYVRHADYAPGERSETVGLVDLYKTITDLAGVSSPSHVEGGSLESLLRAPNSNQWERISVATIGQEHVTRAPSEDHGFVGQSVSHNNWHYIRYEDGSEELYHLLSDPDARVNLIDSELHDPQVYWLSSFLPRSMSFLYGGLGSALYEAGGGDVFINENNSPSSISDLDELYVDAKRNEVSFSQTAWNSNSKTMKVEHPGGAIYIYDQYAETARIEFIYLRDGFYDFTSDGGGAFFSLP